MNRLKQFALSMAVISTLMLASCMTNKSDTGEQQLLIPDELVLSPGQVEGLEKASSKGNCEASYRLFEFYGYCTTEQRVAFEYAKLAYEQGCERAKDDVENMKRAFGE